MKVYLQPPQPSRGLQRIADALQRYAPAVIEVTPYHSEADLVVIYAIGRRERIAGQTRHLLERGRRYAIVQVCLRSTMSPDTRDWLGIWEHAVVVWSYYDLFKATIEDGIYVQGMNNLLHAPLGVDSSVFNPNSQQEKMFAVATSGVSRLQESVRECVMAAKESNLAEGEVLHVGQSAKWFDGQVTYTNGVNDRMLATYYSACHFVSGLRRKEGFELPAAEGLLCGARPVCFDSPDWRFNYCDWAEYIHEGTRQEVVDQLVQLFKQGARPVTQQEREEAAAWFSWERVCGEFWRRCLG